MMQFNYGPGVYVKFVESGYRPLALSSMSTCAFVGEAPDATARVGESVYITNRTEFLEIFCKDKPSTNLSHGVLGFFQEGGSRCFVVNLGKDKSGDAPIAPGLELLEAEGECSLVVAPGRTDAVSYAALIAHCEKMEDRFAILDSPEIVENHMDLTRPAEATPLPPASTEESEAGGKEGRRTPAGGGGTSGLRCGFPDSCCAAYYYPWISVADPLNPKRVTYAPPSGFIAGVYARTDSAYGVHRAPANQTLRSAVGLRYRVTPTQLGDLNSKGVNCIRVVGGGELRVWGARTAGPSTSEYRYVPVKRLCLALKRTLSEQTLWAVFERNSELTWKRIERTCRVFLRNLWETGALVGATPEEAFYVKCDAETNPLDSQLQGVLRTQIGFAPARPAEFVVFELTQMMGQEEEEEASA